MHLQISLIVTLLGVVAAAGKELSYKNPSLSPSARAQDLLSRMTLSEKVAQLLQGDLADWLNLTTLEVNHTALTTTLHEKAGQFYAGQPVSAEAVYSGVEVAQKYLVEHTRLGIPALVQSEGIHGLVQIGATIFPSPIGYAAAFSPALVKGLAGVVGREAKALGVCHIFAPVMDLARELRYGRVEEMFGEDPYLGGEIGYAYVTGLQETGVAATVKHFVGYGTPEGGLNMAPVHGGEREMRSVYLPPFERVVKDAKALSVMSAYHSYDGVPVAADYHLLTEVLRENWGWEYHVITDVSISRGW
jgi:beta-glucosidase